MRSARLSGNYRTNRFNNKSQYWMMAAAAAALAQSGMALAQSAWVGPGGTVSAPVSGTWNAAGNWSPSGVPASSTTTELDFTDASSSAYVSTNNIAGPFTLNTLKINNNGGAIAGSTLSFDGASPAIKQFGTGVFTVSSGVIFAQPTVLQQVAGSELDLTGALSGSLSLSNTSGSGTSTVKLSNANTLSNLTVGANVTVVSALSGNATRLGTGAVTLSGGKLSLQGQLSAGQAIQQPISVSGFNAATIMDAAQINNGPTNSVGVQLSLIDANGQGLSNNSHALYQNGYSNGPTSAFLTPGGFQNGLPASGTFASLTTNINGGHTQFNFAYSNNVVDYTKLNTLYFTPTSIVTGAITTPGPGPETLTLDGGGSKLKTINFLADAQNATTLTAIVNFDDGGSTTYAGAVMTGSWAFPTGKPTNIALAAVTTTQSVVRFRSTARNVEAGAFDWRLTENDIALSAADQNRVVKSITFVPVDPSLGSGNSAEIYAISGEVFQSGTLLTSQTYANAVNVTADSSIDVTTSLVATMGNLTIGSNKLSVTSADTSGGGYSLTLGGVSINGNAAFDVASTTGGGAGILNLGSLNDGGTPHSISFNPTGPGTIVLGSDATSLSAGTVVNIQGGTVKSNTTAALGSMSQINMSAGTLVLGASQTIASLNGNAGVVSIGTNTLTVGTAENLSGTFGGTITGAGSVVSNGGGQVVLKGNNTFAGGAVINSGAIVVAGNTTVNGAAIVSGPVGPAAVKVGAINGANAAQLLLDNTPGRSLPNAVTIISGNTGVTTVGGLNTSGAVTYSGDVTLGFGSTGDFGHDLTLGATNGGEVDFTGKILSNFGSTHGTVNVTNLSGTGSAVVKVANNNSYSGGTVINPNVTYAAALQSSANAPLGTGKVTLAGGILSLQGQLSHGTQQVVPTTGFNAKLIVPHDATSALAATDATIDGGSVLYEQGYINLFDVNSPHGLNNSGTYTSQYSPNVQFQLQPYNGPTSLSLKTTAASGTLALATPGAFQTINLLSNTGDTLPTVQVTFNFADSTTETQTIQVQNWFYNNGLQNRLAVGGPAAGSYIGAITRSNDNFLEFPGSMYEDDLTLAPADQSKILNSISLAVTNFNGGVQNVNFFAVSGSSYAPQTTLATQTLANNVEVTANSGIDVSGSLNAVMGNLNLGFNQLSVTSSSATNAPYSLTFATATVNGNATASVASSAGGGSGTLSLGPVDATSGALTKAGAGKLVLSAGGAVRDALTLNGGTVEIDGGTTVGSLAGNGTGTLVIASANLAVAAHAAGHDSAASLAGLSITGSGRVDLANNDLIINYSGASPISTIRGYLQSGYNGGAWSGLGLASTSAGSDASHMTALGYGEASQLGITSLDGVAVAGNAVIVKYTYYGDGSLDGKVDLGNDFNLFLDGFIAGASGWAEGDYNYDGHVDMNDFKLFLDGYAGQGGNLGQLEGIIEGAPLSVSQKAQLLSVVPEPTSAGLLAVAAVAGLRRRRRSN